jgi:hypothetical protein
MFLYHWIFEEKFKVNHSYEISIIAIIKNKFKIKNKHIALREKPVDISDRYLIYVDR